MVNRRTLLGSGLVTMASAGLPERLQAARHGDPTTAALLLPLTGPGADLARSLHHAADLAQPAATHGMPSLPAFDSGTTPAAAATAVTAALRGGAPLLIGPLYAAQVAATVVAAGPVAVLALSNDAAQSGAFVVGITPTQAIGAILAYARSRGVRRIAVDAGASRWDTACAAVAAAIAPRIGLTLTSVEGTADSVLVPGDGDALAAAAQRLGAARVQLLGTHQGLDLPEPGVAAIEGTWFAAPDPAAFGDFARRFETAFGNPPGLVTGLAYDAAAIARTLRAAGHRDPGAVRDALTGSAGFPGVTGALRFGRDGTAVRELSILVVNGGRLQTVARQPA